MLGLTGVVVAVAAIWAAVLVDERGERQAQSRKSNQYRSKKKHAAEEIVHNLGHIAIADYDEFLQVPQMSTSQLEQLLPWRGEELDDLDERTWRAFSAILRDLEAANNAVAKSPDSRAWAAYCEQLTMASIDALYGIWKSPGSDLGYGSEDVSRQLARLHDKNDAAGSYVLLFRSSYALAHHSERLPLYRATGTPIVCWSDDELMTGVSLLEFAPVFQAWAHPR